MHIFGLKKGTPVATLHRAACCDGGPIITGTRAKGHAADCRVTLALPTYLDTLIDSHIFGGC